MKVVIADDHPVWRRGLGDLLKQLGFDVIGEAATAAELLQVVGAEPPDVAIIDIRMPAVRGGEATPQGGLGAAAMLRGEYPEVGILILSQYSNVYYLRRLIADCGSVGYCSKDSAIHVPVLRTMLEGVAAGNLCLDRELQRELRQAEGHRLGTLTPAELRVAEMVSRGLGNKKIAGELHVTEGVVEKHLTQIYAKLTLKGLDTHKRVSLVLEYLRWSGRLQDADVPGV